jgi:predicted transcriptional regulator
MEVSDARLSGRRATIDMRSKTCLLLTINDKCWTFIRMAKSTKARGTRDALIGFRVTSDLKEQLEQLAEADNRPLSNYLEHVLKAHAEAAKQQEEKSFRGGKSAERRRHARS